MRAGCSRCGAPTELATLAWGRSRSLEVWVVHATTGSPVCSRIEGCPVSAGRHQLADGSLCSDPRHEA